MSKLAINGGSPVRTAPWPAWPQFDDEERSRLLEVFESGKWWYGEKVREFEHGFAAFQDAQFGITCMNGTAGLEAALAGLGIGPGAEVIVPPYTFVATASSVLRAGATPVFVDVELETFNLDPAAFEAAVGPQTAAVIPVHFAGLPCKMDRLLDLCRTHGIRLIEDACHSWGTRWKGKGTGAIGDCGVFSFQMSKNITAGEGGIVLTDDEEVADEVRSFTNCGRGKDTPWYYHSLLGGNLRMTELQAAILLGQLTRLGEQTRLREKNGAILNAGIDALPGVYRQADEPGTTVRSYHLYAVRVVEAEIGISRDRFVDALEAEGVRCSAGYPHPLYRNPVLERTGEDAWQCPNAEALSEQVLWLPHQVLLAGAEDMDDIVRAFEKVIENRSEL